jgi:Flp pilus assembly protein CpaB
MDSTRIGARVARVASRVRRALLRRRRPLAALLVAVAVLAGLQATAGPPPPATRVLVAARDLPAGTTLGPDDLARRDVPSDLVPAGLVADATGRTLATPVRAGEPVTDVRLLGRSLLAAYPDLVAVPVRLPDPVAVSLLEPGALIDLFATDPQGGGSRLLVAGARVLAIPGPDGASRAGAAGPLVGSVVLLGVTPDQRLDLTDALVGDFLSFSFGA